jgi:phosphatidate cytidylyltransferase
LKNLIIRTITGAVFVAAIIAAAIWSPLSFAALFFVVTAISIWEYQHLLWPGSRVPGLWLPMVSGLLIYTLIAYFALGWFGPEYLWLILPVTVLHASMLVFSVKEIALRRISGDLSGIMFIVLPFAVLNIYLNPAGIPEYHTPWLVLGMFVIMWTHDTFAYLSGSLFGKHPLYPAISPKKTWEGSIGGFGFSLVAAYIISIFSPELESLQWFLIAVVIAIFGTIGDLAESLLKRRARVKDSGTLLPGHGGVLDRFDSVLFVSPVILVIILIFTS